MENTDEKNEINKIIDELKAVREKLLQKKIEEQKQKQGQGQGQEQEQEQEINTRIFNMNELD